jgi:hypothetical protein
VEAVRGRVHQTSEWSCLDLTSRQITAGLSQLEASSERALAGVQGFESQGAPLRMDQWISVLASIGRVTAVTSRARAGAGTARYRQ